MKIEKLIDELTKLQKKFPNINVSLFDWRKNLGDDCGDGSFEGFYPEFDISVMKLEGEEADFYREQNDKEFIPWISIGFVNDDYNEEGILLETIDR